MRILLVAPFFPPQRGVASLRTHAFARAFVDAGHDVTVLTTQKFADQVGLNLPDTGARLVEVEYPIPRLLRRLRGASRESGSVTEGGGPNQPNRGEKSSVIGRIKRRLKLAKERTGIFSAVRQPDLTDWWVRPAVAAIISESKTPTAVNTPDSADATKRNAGPIQRGCFDVVVSSGGPPAAHLAALELKRRGAVRTWIADFRDLWTRNHLYTGLFPFTIGERRRERTVLEHADAMTVVSSGLRDRLQSMTDRPIDVIYNGYDDQAVVSADLGAPYFPADGRRRIVYTGTVYPQGQDARPFLHAVRSFPMVRLVVAGPRSDQWRIWAQETGATESLELVGEVPRGDALRMQRDADGLLLLDWKNPRDGVLTGKLFEYLPATAPIWSVGGCVQSPADELIARTGRGRSFRRDVSAIVAALSQLTDDTAEPLPRNERAIAELHRRVQSQRMLEFLDGTVGHRPVRRG